MAGKMALMQKVGQSHLLQNGDVDVDKAPRDQQRLDQFDGRDKIPQAQSRKKHFTKGADIQHPPGLVQPLEGFQWTPTQAVLAIVVILQNPRASLSGPFQQCQTATQAHRHPGGELMRGGGRGQARLWTALPPDLHVQSFLIDRHRHQTGTRSKQSTPRTKVAGILQPDGLARIEQRTYSEIKRALRSSCDDNLFRYTAHSTGDANMRGDGLTQRRVSGRWLVVGKLRQRLPRTASYQTRPDLIGKQIQRWLTTAKGSTSALLPVLGIWYLLEQAYT